MKRTISLLSALAFVLAFSGSVFGQVTATADIISEVSYTADATLDFGAFTTSFSGATLDPTGTGGDSNLNGTAGADYTAGRYDITGSGSQDVTVTLDNSSVDLTHSSDSDYLTLSATLSSATDDINNDRGGSSFTSGNNVSLTNGSATIWIGGTLSATDDSGGGLATGTYENTTDLTLTVDYAF